MAAPNDDWSGPRPLASGAPLLVGGVLVLLLVTVLVVALRPGADVPSEVAAHYVALMAGTLQPGIETRDGEALSRRIADPALGFTPRVGELGPEFALVGGGVHRLGERPAAFWYYRDRRADVLLAEAFAGTLDDVGRPGEVRGEPPVPLHVFRKTTQTLVFWQEGTEVYVVTTTLPGERTIALAQRLAAGSRP